MISWEKLRRARRTGKRSTTVHFVYAGDPTNTELRTPYSITRNVYKALVERFTVTYHDWCSQADIDYGPHDIIIGHPHPHPHTVIQKAFHNPKKCRAKISMHPLHTARIEDNLPFDALVPLVDAIFSICGPYWVDTIDNSRFAHWKFKIIRFDLAVDARDFPYLKGEPNPISQRELLYVGSSIPNKNLGFMAEIMRKMPDVQLTWIGGDGSHPLEKLPNVRSVRPMHLTATAIKPFIEQTDFFISTSDSDANPTTILEAMAWGILPIVSKESGYWPDGRSMSPVYIDDIEGTVSAIRTRMSIRNDLYKEISLENRRRVVNEFNWKLFTDQLIKNLEQLL